MRRWRFAEMFVRFVLKLSPSVCVHRTEVFHCLICVKIGLGRGLWSKSASSIFKWVAPKAVVFFRVRTRRPGRIFPPFPTRFLPRQYIRRLSGLRRSHRCGSMLLLLATHVDLELAFESSSNQPLSYCSEKRSFIFNSKNERFFSALIGQLHVIVGAPKEALRHSHSGQCARPAPGIP